MLCTEAGHRALQGLEGEILGLQDVALAGHAHEVGGEPGVLLGQRDGVGNALLGHGIKALAEVGNLQAQLVKQSLVCLDSPFRVIEQRGCKGL